MYFYIEIIVFYFKIKNFYENMVCVKMWVYNWILIRLKYLKVDMIIK